VDSICISTNDQSLTSPGLIQGVQRDIAQRLAVKRSTLRELSSSIIAATSKTRETEALLEVIANRKKTNKNAVHQGDAEGKVLSKQLEATKVELSQLEYDLEIKPKQFAEAQRREDIRMRQISAKKFPHAAPKSNRRIDGWGDWAWDAIVNPLGYLTQVEHTTTWDVTVNEHRKWEEEIISRRLRLQDQIVRLQHQIESYQRRMTENRSEYQGRSSQDSAQENKFRCELISQERSLKVMVDRQNLIQSSIEIDLIIGSDLV
jgi:hypothetical protein